MSESDAPLTERTRRWTWVVGMRDALTLGEGSSPEVEEWDEIELSTPLERFQALEGQIAAALEPRTQTMVPSKGPLHDLDQAQKTLKGLSDSIAKAGNEASREQIELAIEGAQEAIETINRLSAELERKTQLALEFGRLQQARVPFREAVGPTWFRVLTKEAEKRELAYIKGGGQSVGAREQEELLAPFRDAIRALEPHGDKLDAFAQVIGIAPRVKQLLSLDPGGIEACQQARQALDEANDAWMQGCQAADGNGAAVLAQALQDAVVAFETVQRGRALTAMGGDKPKQSRKDLMALCEKDPGLLSSLASTPEGRAAMDDLVKGYGGMISKKGDQAFIKELMKARFGLSQLEGDLTRKSLPRIYEIFAMVPSEHTHSNPALKAVKRKRNFEPTSWYGEGSNEDEGLGEFHMVIQGARSGGVLGWAADMMAGRHKVTKYREVKGKKSLNCLNAVTLHEIGHAVDAKEGFMDNKGKFPQYGGWQKETKKSIAKVAATERGLLGDFPTIAPAFLETLLEKVLGQDFDIDAYLAPYKALEGIDPVALGQDPSVQATKDWMVNEANIRATADQRKEAVKTIQKKIKAKKGKAILEAAIQGQIIDFKPIDKALTLAVDAGLPAKVDWKKLAKHKAIDWCKTVKMSGGESGLWESNSKSQKAALSGRIYQQAYDSQWVSYAESARAKRVTNYQFRSEAEWFADAYSVYYSGKLPDSHPLKSWLDEQTPENQRP